MLRGLRPLSVIRHHPPVSKLFISSMSSTEIVLPNEDIEKLWFGGLNLRAGHSPSTDAAKRWFVPHQEFDTSCKKFDPLILKLIKLPFNELVALGSTPAESLTLFLLLDQLPRNNFRGSPFPFTESDPLALKLAEEFVLNKHHDKEHPPWKRFWYYLPFEHAESLPHQELGLAKFGEACWEYREGEWKEFHDMYNQNLEFAWKHYILIRKFGRFPTRNKALGREDTNEEKKFLEKGGTVSL